MHVFLQSTSQAQGKINSGIALVAPLGPTSRPKTLLYFVEEHASLGDKEGASKSMQDQLSRPCELLHDVPHPRGVFLFQTHQQLEHRIPSSLLETRFPCKSLGILPEVRRVYLSSSVIVYIINRFRERWRLAPEMIGLFHKSCVVRAIAPVIMLIRAKSSGREQRRYLYLVYYLLLYLNFFGFSIFCYLFLLCQRPHYLPP